jgi:hypothetical protein
MPETTSVVVFTLFNLVNVILASLVKSDCSTIAHHRDVHFWFQNERGVKRPKWFLGENEAEFKSAASKRKTAIRQERESPLAVLPPL